MLAVLLADRAAIHQKEALAGQGFGWGGGDVGGRQQVTEGQRTPDARVHQRLLHRLLHRFPEAGPGALAFLDLFQHLIQPVVVQGGVAAGQAVEQGLP